MNTSIKVRGVKKILKTIINNIVKSLSLKRIKRLNHNIQHCITFEELRYES
jgi:hypothetical protein